MNPQLKRILTAVGLVAAVVLISLLIWWQFFLVPLPPGTKSNRSFLGRVLPDIADQLRRGQNLNRAFTNRFFANVNRQLPKPSDVANGGATVATPLVPTPTDALTPGSTGQDVQYYDRDTGKFYRISPDGTTKTVLSDQAFPGAEKVDWSPNGSKAVLSFPDDSKIIYDFEKKKQTSLPKEAEDFSFSPDSDQLVYKFQGRDEQDRFLAVSNSDGSETKFVEPIGDKGNQVTPNWSPNRQIVATFEQGANATQQEIVFLGTQNENFPSALVPGRGFQGEWSPDGNSMLFTVRTRESLDNPTLWVMDGRPDTLGQRQVNLGVETFIDKCAFGAAASVVYCAVPAFLPEGAGRVPELARGIPDDFWEIDLTNGSRRLLAKPTDASGSATFSATEVVVSQDARFLYFRDQRTNAVHQIRLK